MWKGDYISLHIKQLHFNIERMIEIFNNILEGIDNTVYALENTQIKIAKARSNLPSKWLHPHYKHSGISFGKEDVFGIRFNVAYYCTEHILIVGTTGGGKTSTIIKPTLHSWSTPIIASDIKGELSEEYIKCYSNNHQALPYIIFNPLDKNGYTFDVFGYVHSSNQNDVVPNITEIAYAIIPDTTTSNDPFWERSERNLLIGALLYYYDLGASFSQALVDILSKPITKLFSEIINDENEKALLYINPLINLDAKTLSNILMGFSSKLTLFASDDSIIHALSGHKGDKKCFDWSFAETHCIFLNIPEEKLQQWSSMLSLMFNQLLNSLARRPEQHTIAGSKNDQILVLLDEFPKLGKLNIVSNITTLRSKQVTFALCIQSLAQLDLIYGTDGRKIITDNCKYKALFNSFDPDTQEYMSRVVGEHEVKKYSETIVDNKCTSKTLTTQYEPLIRPYEFKNLSKLILVTPDGSFKIDKYPSHEKHKYPLYDLFRR